MSGERSESDGGEERVVKGDEPDALDAAGIDPVVPESAADAADEAFAEDDEVRAFLREIAGDVWGDSSEQAALGDPLPRVGPLRPRRADLSRGDLSERPAHHADQSAGRDRAVIRDRFCQQCGEPLQSPTPTAPQPHTPSRSRFALFERSPRPAKSKILWQPARSAATSRVPRGRRWRPLGRRAPPQFVYKPVSLISVSIGESHRLF